MTSATVSPAQVETTSTFRNRTSLTADPETRSKPPVTSPGGVKLPQHATPAELKERQRQLQHYRQLYHYESPETIPGIAFLRAPVEDIPEERPSRKWRMLYALAKFRRELNFARVDLASIAAAFWTIILAVLGIAERAAGLVGGPKSHSKSRAERVAARIAATKARPARFGYDFEERSEILKPYRDLFRTLQLPAIADVFMEDDVFCRLRVAGFNPFSLSAVTSRDKLPFPIADSDLPPGDSVAAAIAAGRLFAQDFRFLAEIAQTTKPNKQVPVANAVFVLPQGRSRGDLWAVAVSVNGAVVRPPARPERFPGAWTVAKLALNSCDALHHQLVAHLCHTHLMLEPFVAATMRQLAPAHPLRRLLRPHLEGTAFINENAALELVVPGGPVDRILAGDVPSAMAFVARYAAAMRFNDMMPDADAAKRGIAAPKLHMPYRDDALAHWEALLEWVGAFVRAYYRGDADVARDRELQAWAAEVADPARGRVAGFGDAGDGRVRTRAYLVRAVANVIFKASVQHAAVNFPQGSLMMYPPATPGFLWGQAPDLEECDRDAWRGLLAPLESAIEQMEVFSILGGVYYTRLGQYRRGEIPDTPAIKSALEVYQQRLAVIEENIVLREKDEIVKYEFCRPSLVPQSTNI